MATQHRCLSRFLNFGIAATVFVIALPAVSQAQTTSTWNGTTGNWTDIALWTGGVPQNGQPNPGDTYNAIVNGGGAITLNTNIVIQQLNFQNGTITGTNSLTMNALMTWSGGTFAGGSIFANGGASITGATTNQYLTGGALTLGGAASTWSGGEIYIDNGSVLTNAAGSVFTATGDNGLNRSSFGGTATFVNAGTFRKQTGSGTTTINSGVTFTNSGTVDVQSGTLTFNGGGSSTGAFTVANGATLAFNGGSTLDMTAGAGVSGAGTTAFSGGITNVSVPFSTATVINGGTANFNSVSNTIPSLTFSNGSLGGNAAVGVTGALTWSGGSFTGSTTTVNGGGSITGATTNQYMTGGALTLGGGTTTWSGGEIYIDNGSVLTNAAGSVFTATGDNGLNRSSFGGTATFVNAGTFRKQTGSGTTTINSGVTFTNSGTVDVQSGTLTFNGGGSSTGAFTVANGATLAFNGGSTLDMTAGAGVSGAGTTAFSGGITNVSVPFSTATVINGGTANFNSVSNTIPSLTFSNGSLGGNAAVGVTGALTWSGGSFTGSTTTVNGGGSITGATTNQYMTGGALTLGGGTTTWSGGEIYIDNGSVLTNAAGSVFTATGDNGLNRSSFGGTATFVNAGTFRKQTGSGTTTINSGVTFTNSGTVDVQSGTLTFNGGGSSTGAFTVANGATLAFNGGSTLDMTAGAGVSGAGTTAFSGGITNVSVPFSTATVINGGTANFNGVSNTIPSLTFSNGSLGGNAAVGVTGALTWSGGSFTGSTTTVNGGGSITGATTNQYMTGGALTLGGGTTTWSGGEIYIDNGSVLTNAAGSVFTATGNNGLSRSSFGGTATFANAGTFRKQTGTGTTAINDGVTFANTGTLDVQSGTLAIGSSLTNTATVTNAVGTTISGPITSNSGGIVRGVGSYGGPLQFNSGSTLHPGLSPGILTATGAVTMASGATFSVELNGTSPGSGHGQLLLSGAGASINLGGANLATTLGYMPSGADSLTIIAGGPVAGTFVNAQAGQPFAIGSFGGTMYNAFATYNPNSVVLSGFTPVPEPVHILCLAGMAGAFYSWRRKRNRNQACDGASRH